MDDRTDSKAAIQQPGAPGPLPVVMPRGLASRAANSTTHGLTARKLLPEIFGPELLERHRESFRSEWQPATPTEACLVEELARHAAALERATPIEVALLRTSARSLSGISDSDGDEDAGKDRVLAAACGTETVDRLTRYRRAHEKGLLSALARLRELRPTSDVVSALVAQPLRFEEKACLRYLQRYRDARELACPSCGGAKGRWLVGRELWQCRQCRRQLSARSGTVLARSQLSLRTWFSAIAAILRDRHISTDALCDVTGVRRAKTVRTMAQRIREAIDAPESEQLLAGLDTPTLTRLSSSGR
jgi:transposase-like protein